MSKSVKSPTARLLQSSRLFSLPRPLPQPTLGLVKSDGTYRASDTATTPYPVYQAIATPTSSHFRGDWGLKRPLPARSGKSTTAHIRVKGQDNFAHVTDFESAADHTLSEAKWRQMGVPFVVRDTRTTYSNLGRSTYSAYDEHLDNTDPEAVEARQALDTNRQPGRDGVESVQWSRWKHASPWVAGMQDGEFDVYLRTRLEARKDEFREFMIKRLVQHRLEQEQRKLRDQGRRQQLPSQRRIDIFREISSNWATEEKKLRDDFVRHRLVSELSKAIQEFLDLPRMTGDGEISAQSSMFKIGIQSYTGNDQGPLTTHPAAGLSHIRTSAIMENHPFWGPQAQPTPVLARVVRPRQNDALGNAPQAMVGVGGFVTNHPEKGSSHGNRSAYDIDDADRMYLETQNMLSTIEPDLPGGNKVWVHPRRAEVTEQGRVKLQIGHGDPEAIAVARDDVESIHEKKSGQLNSRPLAPSLPSTKYARGNARPQSWVTGHDDDSESIDAIKGLMGGGLPKR